MKTVTLGSYKIANSLPFCLIAGPCQLESLEHARKIASHMVELCDDLGIPYVFKASYDKANRSSIGTQRGLGIDKGLEVLAAIKDEFKVPVLTDVHAADQCEQVGKVCDVIQIPAFLCRQTDLLIAAGETGKAINVKKGQFLAPWDMVHVADKIASTGNENILLTDRGSSFRKNRWVLLV